MNLVDIYFRDHPYALTQHQLDSYREFLRTFLPAVIRSMNPMTMLKLRDNGEEIQVDVFVGGDEEEVKIYMDRPTLISETGEQVLMTPAEARLRGATYASKIYTDILLRYTLKTASGKEIVDVPLARQLLGTIPIMLHSDACILHGQSREVLQSMGECIYDRGGYFVIDGKEKVVVSQERIATNRLYFDKSKDPNYGWTAFIRCTSEKNLVPRTVKFFQVNPEINTQVKQILAPFRGAILVNVPALRVKDAKIPLFVLFRALGVESDRDIYELFASVFPKDRALFRDLCEERLRMCAVHAASLEIFTQEAALEFLSRYVYFTGSVDQVRHLLAEELFVNMGRNLYSKRVYLAYLVLQIFETERGMVPPVERDTYMFKRVDLSGIMIAKLFEEAYTQFRNGVRDSLDREYHYGASRQADIRDVPRLLVLPENAGRIFQSDIIADTMIKSLKGSWGVVDGDKEQGMVQDLSRVSYLSFLSHLRRVDTDLDRSIKLVAPHRLHAQQWGIMCPFESPDGASIGYLKNFALLTMVTSGTEVAPIRKFLLDEMGVVQLQYIARLEPNMHRVFINGEWIGVCRDPAELVQRMRLLRRNGLVSPFLSVTWDIGRYEVRFNTDAGRPCRPLRILRNTKTKMGKNASWYDMVFGSYLSPEKRNDARYYFGGVEVPEGAPQSVAFWKKLEECQGSLEFLDIEEENMTMIAMSENEIRGYTTHIELSATTAFSVVTNNIPFCNHNQAPRNYFFGAQSKQALGVYSTNFHSRFDTASYLLHYPQRPLVATEMSKHLMVNELGYGTNLMVAVMTYSGFNQEDGVMINRAAIDRGMFKVSVFKTMVAEESRVGPSTRIQFMNPKALRDIAGETVENINGKVDYESLGDNGVIRQGDRVGPYDNKVLVGMCVVSETVEETQDGIFKEKSVAKKYKDISMTSDQHHYGVVDKVFVGTRGGIAQEKIGRIRFRQDRRPELGDKCSSRHGQKGTVGMIMEPHDMPFTKDGLVPDMIINPHAFPSRMTIGHIVECVLAKLAAAEGALANGTPFVNIDYTNIGDNLAEHNLERHGNEVLYDGRSGKQIETDIFFGPTYYMRLKHMVEDKTFSRSTGPRELRTHQPVSGRGNEGGLRIGEMERDVLLAHGMVGFAKESMMERSDKYRYQICAKCGVVVDEVQWQECRFCGKAGRVATIETPYAFKLLAQELSAMGVQMRLFTEEEAAAVQVLTKGGAPEAEQTSASEPEETPAEASSESKPEETLAETSESKPEETPETSESKPEETPAETSESKPEETPETSESKPEETLAETSESKPKEKEEASEIMQIDIPPPFDVAKSAEGLVQILPEVEVKLT